MKLLSSALLWTMVCLSGCVHMASISTTSIPVERTKPVEAEAYRFLFLMINFDNFYVDELTRDLASQCPDGRVEGILTKQEDIMYFPAIAHAVRVTATGFCVVDAPSEPTPPSTEPQAEPPPTVEPVSDEMAPAENGP
ncbi:MAG: hypothetical protein CL930_13670 [Deltaproteobacteria bacterium]|nr:hypothetical protein [Deltaproteobacteria bacterium]|tara:strand:+ start:174 stop:587 length:414 start_codon:yes stop_codon:yes gene_type:complete